MNKRHFVAAALIVGVAIAACGPRQPPPTTGTLTVTVTPPDGGAAAVSVAGPNGYAANVTATETLQALEPGSYTITSARVIVPGAVVSTIHEAAVSGSPATVVAGENADAAVSYAQRIGTGMMWVADRNANSLYSYSPDQLTASGSPTPMTGIGMPPSSQQYTVAFDTAGNLWTALPTGPQKIVRLAPALLGTSGTPTATASISDTHGPTKMTFDAQGNLWVADQFNATIVKYQASDLTDAGTLTATPVVTFSNAGFKTLNALAFDPAGNLWVANSDFTSPPYSGVLHKLAAADLAQTGPVTATLASTYNHASILAPQGMAFDKNGALWVADFGTNGTDPNLIRFDQSQLNGTGAVGTAPALTITSAAMASPNAIAFDEAGNLWLANYSNRTVVRFAASVLAGTGTSALTPGIIINGPQSGMGFSGLAFGPAAAGVPLPR